jgi:hypothetical protein
MSDLYKNTYRGYLIDHHSPNPPIVTLDKLDVSEYEAFYKKANINNLMVYFKDHWGVTYYDSAAGTRHPGLKEDWIKRLVPVLKRNGIEFNAYYSLEYDTLAFKEHPDWRIIDAEGQPKRVTGRMAKWGIVCYETGYRNYVLEQLGEIVGGYKPDSLFLDIFGKSLCYCPVCRKKFKKIYNYDIPENEAELNENSTDILSFLDICAEEMLQDIIDTVKKIDPDIKVTINFSSLYNKKIRDMLDYQFTEPWAGNWLSSAYARDTAVGQYPQMGPGDVSDVYNYRHENIYTLAASEIAAQGCRVFIYSGSQHPDGTLEHEEAERVGKAYTEIKKFEEYLRNRRAIADIGIIKSDTSDIICKGSKVEGNAIARVKAGSEHRDSVLGAMKLFDYSKFAWKIVPEQDISYDDIKELKVLVLPDFYYISDEVKEILERYVKEGGVLIGSGKTSLYDCKGEIRENFSLGELFGCDYIGVFDKYKDNHWGSYLSLTEDAVWKYMPKTTPPTGPVRYLVQSTTARTVANFINPATELTEETWVNWWSPPPAHITNEPAVLVNSYGIGKAIYCSFDLFKMENQDFNWVEGFISGLLEEYVVDPRIKLITDYPNILKMAFYERQEGRELIIHQLSSLPARTKGEAVGVDGGTVTISGKWKKVKQAEIVYPERKPLALALEGGRYSIKLPAVTIHQIVRIICG